MSFSKIGRMAKAISGGSFNVQRFAFWIISVRQRVLQFGIFRAMGMNKNELYRMIFYEQLMISFVSIIAGILIGGVASQMFVPLFERM